MHQPCMPMMSCPQMGMMPPMGPMPHQPGMMPHNNMPPMGCPQMGMMPPMGPKPGKKNHHMPPMGPQMGMMSPMGPMPHQPGMMPHNNMPPMGCPQMGMMPQPNMMGCCPCQMRPPMFGFKDYKKERKLPFDFLFKLFSCKKDKDSDIMLKDKGDKSEKQDKNRPIVPLKPEEKK